MSLECASAHWHPQAQPLESAGGPPAVALAPQQPAQAPPAAPASDTAHDPLADLQLVDDMLSLLGDDDLGVKSEDQVTPYCPMPNA